MVNICCIESCVNHVIKKEDRNKPNNETKFHRFPTNESLRIMWKDKCQIGEKTTKDPRVCSRHFDESDYEQKKKRREIRPNAVPHIELPKIEEPNVHFFHRVILPRNLQGSNNSCVYQVSINETLTVLLSFDASLFTEEPSYQIPGVKIVERERDALKEKVANLSEIKDTYEAELASLKHKLSSVKQELKYQRICNKRNIEEKHHWRKQNSARLKKLCKLRKKCDFRPQNKKKEKLYQAVTKIFSPAQVRALISDKKRAKWSSDDIAKSIAMRAKSNQLYSFMRDGLGYPFPERTTLLRWSKGLCFRPGVQIPVLDLLKVELANAPPLSKEGVVCLDEMNIDSRMAYDPSTDSILGLSSGMTVAMLSSLGASWKQPVYFGFEKTTTVDTLMDIITKVEEAGIRVRSITCDMGGPNQSLANKLGISEEKPYFTNPVSGEKVYWFYDAPHLLKLLRNHILDSKGLKLKCGKTIDKSVFEKILRADSQDFKICYKLTQKHISLNNREKQRVCYAAQLLSRTTSLAIESLDPNNKEISEFVALVNDWFDVFNSRHPNDPIRKPFGMDLENQTAILDRMSDEIRHLRKGDKRAMLPFQRGILISINSLKALFNDLSTGPLKMRYTITRAYNQDKLENCFGMIRAVGRYHDCPNAYEAQCRLKTVMLGWNYRENTRSVSANIEDSAPTTFLSSLLLSSLNKNSTGCTEDGSCEDDVQDPDVENNQLDEDELPSEENWNEFYGKLNSSEKCEFGGKEYVCGFIARKLKKKFPQLSLGHTSSVTRMPQSWVQRKSRGNLTVPTYDWLAMCSKLDKVFVQHHDVPGPVKVNQNPGAIRGLRRKLEKRFPEIPPQAIRLFVRTRTFIRIKHVNHNIVANRFSRNKKGAQFAKSSMNLRNQNRNNEGFSILNFDDEEMSTTCRGI